MNKPNCKCATELTDKIKEHHGLTDEAFVYFRDMNLFTGGLASYVIIEERVKTKAGKEKKRNFNIPVVHNYCPFCGKQYIADERVIITSQKSFSPPEPLSTEEDTTENKGRIVDESKVNNATS